MDDEISFTIPGSRRPQYRRHDDSRATHHRARQDYIINSPTFHWKAGHFLWAITIFFAEVRREIFRHFFDFFDTFETIQENAENVENLSKSLRQDQLFTCVRSTSRSFIFLSLSTCSWCFNFCSSSWASSDLNWSRRRRVCSLDAKNKNPQTSFDSLLLA